MSASVGRLSFVDSGGEGEFTFFTALGQMRAPRAHLRRRQTIGQGGLTAVACDFA